MLEQLDRSVAPPRAQTSRRPCERLPHAVLELLQEEHLARWALDRDPRRYDPCVVDDDERVTDLPW
jgi:hypothetical protein